MANANNPHDPAARQAPQHQTGEDFGGIKRPQVTDGTMTEKDLPRGSENETRRRG